MDLDLDLEMDRPLPTTKEKEEMEVSISSGIQARPQQQRMNINTSIPSNTQLPIKKQRGRPKGWRKSIGGAYTDVQPLGPSVARSFEAPTNISNGTEASSALPMPKNRGRPKGSKNRVLDLEVVARVGETRDGELSRPGRVARGDEVNYNVKLAFKRLREVEEVEEVDDTVEREFVDARLSPKDNDTVIEEGQFVVVKKKDGRGRPKGSKNKDKSLVAEAFKNELEATPVPRLGKKFGLKKSPIIRRSFGGFVGRAVKAFEQVIVEEDGFVDVPKKVVEESLSKEMFSVPPRQRPEQTPYNTETSDVLPEVVEQRLPGGASFPVLQRAAVQTVLTDKVFNLCKVAERDPMYDLAVCIGRNYTTR